MDDIVNLLDKLAEYQAQADLLEIQKRELIDAVKVPAEVLAVQDEINKRRQKIEADSLAVQKEIQAETAAQMAAIPDPDLPAEFVAALAAARAKREAIQRDTEGAMNAISNHRAEQMAQLDAELQAKTKQVYAQVEQRKQEIACEFIDKAGAVSDNMSKLTEAIKAATVEAGRSVKGAHYQAVYVKGRITWNTDMLDGLIVAFPALAKARKEGQPSVSIRRV
jgi:hypothetical protein